MLRSGLWTLRQPRYAALAALMLLVAALCVLAGTWQISRFEQSVRENDALKANAHAATVALTPALVALSGQGPAPGRDAIRFRTVTVSGQYRGGAAQFVRNQTLNGVNGYDVLSPLQTAAGVLLVERGFVAADAEGNPPVVTAPPAGPVSVIGRLANSSTGDDAASRIGGGQLESVNPQQQSARLGAPVYQAYLTLTGDSPGTQGVTVLPAPDLSNPAGGAYEAQHFAYVIQWYLFALLALAAPFAISRSERRDAQRRYLGIDPDNEEFGLDPADDPLALSGAADPDESDGSDRSDGSGGLAVRAPGALARAGRATPQQWRQAEALANRYGRSLGPGAPAAQPGSTAEPTPAGARPERDRPERDRPERSRAVPVGGVGGSLYVMPTSATAPYRSGDGYQGSYNDYLWQLALADGLDPAAPRPRTGPDPAAVAPPVDGSPLLPPPGPMPITGRQAPDERRTDPDESGHDR